MTPDMNAPGSSLSVELDFDDLTWGELRQFVALGDGIPDDAPVEHAHAMMGYDDMTGLRISRLPRRASGER